MSCNRPIPCDDPIDPLGGATIPPGYSADVTYIDGQPVWSTDPAQPPEDLPVLLVNQNQGGVLLDESIFVAL
jgi:hypothetical protein